MEQMITVLELLQIATTTLCETEIISCSLNYASCNKWTIKKQSCPSWGWSLPRWGCEGDLPTVKNFMEAVVQVIENRFNVSDAVKEQNIVIFVTILDPHYHQLKFKIPYNANRSRLHDLVIRGKTFAIVQQFEARYNRKAKNSLENLRDWKLIRESFPPRTICIIR